MLDLRAHDGVEGDGRDCYDQYGNDQWDDDVARGKTLVSVDRLIVIQLEHFTLRHACHDIGLLKR